MFADGRVKDIDDNNYIVINSNEEVTNSETSLEADCKALTT